MKVPDLLSSGRRWCWSERVGFTLIFLLPIFAGFGIAWWGISVYAVAIAFGFAVDVLRHARAGSGRP